MGPEEQSIRSQIGQYLEIGWRRKYCALLFPFVVAAAVYYALTLPQLYESVGVILVENQSISQDIVRSTVTSYAAEQIEVIRQQVQSTQNVLAIIQDYGLYSDSPDADPALLTERFRERMNVETVTANVTDPGSGRQRSVSIAFRISFQDESPDIAQKIATDLSKRFLVTNSQNRTREAAETSTFLRKEADVLQSRVVSIEDEIAAFRNKNVNSLPELLEYNLDVISTSEDRIRQNQVTIENLSEQEQLLSIELRSIDPYTGAQLGAADPETGSFITPAAQLNQAKSQLDQLLQRYSPAHPSVVAQKNEIIRLEAQVAAVNQADEFEEATTPDDNEFSPAYLQLRFRIGAIERDKASLVEENKELKREIKTHNERVSRTYIVQRELDELQRDYQATFTQYEDLRSAQYEAEVAQTLEEESRSERLTLIESPKLPTVPVGPDRPTVMLMGVGVAGILCIGLAFLFEILDERIHGRLRFVQIIGEPPLVVIPTIDSSAYAEDNNTGKRKWLLWLILLIFIVAALGAAAFYFELVDLESINLSTPIAGLDSSGSVGANFG